MNKTRQGLKQNNGWWQLFNEGNKGGQGQSTAKYENTTQDRTCGCDFIY